MICFEDVVEFCDEQLEHGFHFVGRPQVLIVVHKKLKLKLRFK